MSRVRVELALFTVFAALAVITLVWPSWIESLVGLSPDAGAGTTEWWLVGAFGAAALMAGVRAWQHHARLLPTQSR